MFSDNIAGTLHPNVLENVLFKFPGYLRLKFSENVPKTFCDNLLKMKKRYALMFLKTFSAGQNSLNSNNVQG